MNRAINQTVLSAAIAPVLLPMQREINRVELTGLMEQSFPAASVMSPSVQWDINSTVVVKGLPNIPESRKWRLLGTKGDQARLVQLNIKTGEPIKGKTKTVPVQNIHLA